MTDISSRRVVEAFRALDYQRNGVCEICGEKAYVARSSARHPWRCPSCVQKRLERRKPV